MTRRLHRFSGHVVYTPADIAEWTVTRPGYPALNAVIDIGRSCTTPGAAIPVAILAKLRDDSVWAKSMAVLAATTGDPAMTTRIGALHNNLDLYQVTRSWVADPVTETQRLNCAWIVCNMLTAAALIGYVPSTGFETFLRDACFPILDWKQNGNWHAVFAAAKLAIAALLRDAALWATARAYFDLRLPQSIYLGVDGPTVPLMRGTSGALSTSTTTAQWGAQYHAGASAQVDATLAVSSKGLPFPDGTNAERLNDHGHVNLALGGWVHAARTILAQGDTLAPGQRERIVALANYHATRVLPYLQAGIHVAPWPAGGAGGQEYKQAWLPARRFAAGDAGPALTAICAHPAVTGYPPAGANHLTAEIFADT